VTDIKGGIAGMFWRFLVADDPTVDRFIIRDSDSRLNARERFAVEVTSYRGIGMWKHCATRRSDPFVISFAPL